MNKLFSTLLTVIASSVFSCSDIDTQKNTPETVESENNSDSNRVFTNDWKSLTKDFTTWYNYTYYNVRLSQDFIGLDTDSEKIDKTTFLNKLMTENVVAYKIRILHGAPVFKLFNLNSGDEGITSVSKQMASTEIMHFRMEGHEIPEFNFTDLNGNTYSKSSTKGKIVLFKCWFIHCVACVKEFPGLNKLVEENQGRNDILFISLAIDSRDDLVKFLKTKEFKYAVIPGMKNYMSNKLHITEYPTHLLIDSTGKIIKVVNRIEDLIPFLKKETGKTSL